jgi:hypothetical protein
LGRSIELLSDKAGARVAVHDIRIAVVEPYIVTYRYRADTVTVVRMVDGRRNITRRLVRE